MSYYDNMSQVNVKKLLGSVRVKSFQKLILLHWFTTNEKDHFLYRNAKKRLKKMGAYNNSNVWGLTEEDIMKFLSCSRRTAKDYKKTIQTLNL